jgi:chaperonin cofactor prefoldin
MVKNIEQRDVNKEIEKKIERLTIQKEILERKIEILKLQIKEREV